MSAFALILAFLSQQATVEQAGTDLPDRAVDQLTDDRPSSATDLSMPDVVAGSGSNPAAMQQLPPTLDAPADHVANERTLIRGDEKKTLVGEVARASEMLRQRGQQPTPETLAREIGPDALASFLNQDPSALDSYAIPKDDPGTTPSLPESGEGAIILLPPSQ